MAKHYSTPLVLFALTWENFTSVLDQVEKGFTAKFIQQSNVYNSEFTRKFRINCELIISRRKVILHVSNCVKATMAVRTQSDGEHILNVDNSSTIIFCYKEFMNHNLRVLSTDILVVPLYVHLKENEYRLGLERCRMCICSQEPDSPQIQIELPKNMYPKGSLFRELPYEIIDMTNDNEEEIIIEEPTVESID
jgi:hypothetical protein